MAWTNEIRLSGTALGDAKRNSAKAPWRFTLLHRGGKNDQEFSIHCWHDCGADVKRGQEILVSGKLKHERWQDADGGRRERVSLEADSIAPIEAPEAAPLRPITAADPITDADVPI